ncbi:hypothetical protein HNR06_001636 [Nocardiopsis arvandica]|uniref:Knr4/Smi1-like domain-containing protein n=1 Tax=Nocardiopsis sinuspersici TaxID=501010 RepID=A0A7Y9XBR6_9ACTN|nr:SMI1/KNR4 family protein [Nocardiopsis sinuspersici]NYH52047.1 hypothetical protein [Nocardiopsis sinuspersici]
MEFAEFEHVLSSVRDRGEEGDFPEGYSPFDFWSASQGDILLAEQELKVSLPEAYVGFMRGYGGGQFLFLDLLTVVSHGREAEDLISVNRSSPLSAGFLALAPVGTGDWWGFPVRDGACTNAVALLDHEDGRTEPLGLDFLEFLIREGLRVQ